MQDLDFDLDDLLDSIDDDIAALDSENEHARLDRLHVAFDEASQRYSEASAAFDSAGRLARRQAGISSEYRWLRAIVTQWPNNDDPWSPDEQTLDRYIKCGLEDDIVWAPGIDRDAVQQVLSAASALVRAMEARDEAQRVFNDAATSCPPIEGCYVAFKTRTSQSNWDSFKGVVTGITAGNYIVALDNDPYSDAQTARIKIATARHSVWTRGGRELRVLWGPVGNAQRAERDRLARIAAEEQRRKEEAARERCRTVMAIYDQARHAEDEHTFALQRAPQHAATEAAQQVLAKYAAEVEALASSLLADKMEALSHYERPEVLDNPPSRDWRDYLDAEVTA